MSLEDEALTRAMLWSNFWIWKRKDLRMGAIEKVHGPRQGFKNICYSESFYFEVTSPNGLEDLFRVAFADPFVLMSGKCNKGHGHFPRLTQLV